MTSAIVIVGSHFMRLICDKVILKYDKSALGIDDVEITDEDGDG